MREQTEESQREQTFFVATARRFYSLAYNKTAVMTQL